MWVASTVYPQTIGAVILASGFSPFVETVNVPVSKVKKHVPTVEDAIFVTEIATQR